LGPTIIRLFFFYFFFKKTYSIHFKYLPDILLLLFIYQRHYQSYYLAKPQLSDLSDPSTLHGSAQNKIIILPPAALKTEEKRVGIYKLGNLQENKKKQTITLPLCSTERNPRNYWGSGMESEPAGSCCLISSLSDSPVPRSVLTSPASGHRWTGRL